MKRWLIYTQAPSGWLGEEPAPDSVDAYSVSGGGGDIFFHDEDGTVLKAYARGSWFKVRVDNRPPEE